MRRVGIIGGGPAGLAAAHYLARQGLQVTLFEAAPELGGLARSFQLGDVTLERYYHFICRGDHGYFRMLAELGLEDRLRWTPTRMGYFYEGRLYPFSSAVDLLRFSAMSVVSRVRYGLATLAYTRIRDWRSLDRKEAKPWLISTMGRECYDVIWHPLLSVKFPQSHERISAAWVWHRVQRVADSRKSLFHGERLGFLEGGTQSLVDALEASLRANGVTVHLERPIDRILADSDGVKGIRTTDGEEMPFDRVVSAVPLPHYVRMAPALHPDHYERLAAIDFIGVVCIVLRLRRALTPNFWTNVHDSRIPFNGCIEYSNMNPDITGDGSSILYIPHYLPRTHERFGYDDERLLEECLDSLGLINPDFRPEDVIDHAVSRDPFAQIICPAGFADLVPGHRTPVEGLYLIESSQLYPSDRAIGPTLELADRVTDLICADEQIDRRPT